jgi:hypothetical protein
MLQGPNRAPLILGVTVVLAFGAGFVAQSVTGDTSGQAMVLTVLPIVGLGIIAMVVWQGGWIERNRAAPPQRSELEELRLALAVKPASADDGVDESWNLAAGVFRDGRNMVFLICALMIPALMLQKVQLILLAAIPIVLYAVYLAFRTVMRGGTYDQAFDALDRRVAPLGLEVVDRPKIVIRPRFDGTDSLRHQEIGPTVLEGVRHGRRVRVEWDGKRAVTTVGDITIERRGKDHAQAWLYDLQRAEQQADGVLDAVPAHAAHRQ